MLYLPRDRDEILNGRLHRPAGRGRFTPKGTKPGDQRNLSLSRGGVFDRRGVRLSGGAAIPAGTPSGTRAWYADGQGQPTGTSAILDSGKFKYTTGSGTSLLQLVDTTGLDFPAGLTNVWRAELPASDVSRMVGTGPSPNAGVASGSWSTPNVGSPIYYRVYSRVTFPSGYATGANGNHPFESNGLGQVCWTFKFTGVAAGIVTLRILVTTASGQLNYDCSNVFAINTTYRWEWKLTRVTSNTATMDVRMYNSVGTLVANSTSFTRSGGSTLAAENPSLNMALGDGVDAQFQDFMMGNNGPDNNAGSGGVRDHSEYMYWGAPAVGLVDWLGPWTSSNH